MMAVAIPLGTASEIRPNPKSTAAPAVNLRSLKEPASVDIVLAVAAVVVAAIAIAVARLLCRIDDGEHDARDLRIELAEFLEGVLRRIARGFVPAHDEDRLVGQPLKNARI